MPTEDEIFRIAFALPTAEARLEYLKQVCHDGKDVERIVALLKEGSPDESFLEKPPLDLTEDLPNASSMVGETIGPFKLLQSIGEGGFGVVYMAEQTSPGSPQSRFKSDQTGNGHQTGCGTIRSRATGIGYDGPSEYRQSTRWRRNGERTALLCNGVGQRAFR